jgi:glycosyltransferase involved in cell wall biosynthesis
VIAGEGLQRAELEEIIRQLGLEQSVHLVGFRSDVPALMAHADLVVISSEREGFPYAMVEALHLEKVIVSTRFPGAEDLLPEQFLVPYGDEPRLRQVVETTLAEIDQARHDFAALWQQARSELTVKRMVEQTRNVYQRVLSEAA